MKIKILSLYPDLMNLYGSSGNVRCLVRHIEENGVETEIYQYTIGDKIDFSDVDIILMGAGTERSRNRVLCDMQSFRDELKSYIDNGGLCLFCGNSFELLGKRINCLDESTIETLGFYSFESYELKRRIVIDTVLSCSLFDEKIIGFMNKQTSTTIVPTPLFRVISGTGNSNDRNDEGIMDKGLFATQLSGPVLVRNPHFRAYIEKKIYEKKGIDKEPITFLNEQKAYEMSLKGLLG